MLSASKSSALRASLLAAVVAAGFAGCGAAATVDRADLEEQVQTKLSQSVGQEAPKASCPDDLKAETAATTRCSMTFDEGKLGITVKVTSVEDDTAKFDVKADEKLQPAS